MRNWLGSSLRIGLSKQGISVLLTSGGWRGGTTVLADHSQFEEAFATPEQLALQCQTILAASNCTGMLATIILADDWVRFLMVTPPHNAACLQDCRAAAEMRFQGLYGEPSSGWKLEADWHARNPFLACAMPQALLIALKNVALKCKLHLVSITPQFIAAWNMWHASLHTGGWFGVVQQEVLTLGAIDQQRLCAVRTTSIPSDSHSGGWLHQHVTREALRLNLPVPKQLQLCGNYPANWEASNAGPDKSKLTIRQLRGVCPAPGGRIVSLAENLARSGMRT